MVEDFPFLTIFPPFFFFFFSSSSSFHLSSNYRCVKICLGKRDLVHELLKTHWGMVFFTGGENAAKHICKAAAEQLSPVCMELGGKNPVYITKNANLETAILKLVHNKFLNVSSFKKHVLN